MIVGSLIITTALNELTNSSVDCLLELSGMFFILLRCSNGQRSHVQMPACFKTTTFQSISNGRVGLEVRTYDHHSRMPTKMICLRALFCWHP